MKKKIISAVALGLVVLLIIGIFVLYLVRVNYVPKLDNPDSIQVYKDDKHNTFSSDKNAYNDILVAYNNSFNQKLLSAIFAGQTGGAFNQQTNGDLPTTNSLSVTAPYIKLDYDNAQTLVVNGYTQDLTVNQVILEVKDSSKYAEVKIYYKQANTTSSYYYMTTLANQSALYKVIDNLQLA